MDPVERLTRVRELAERGSFRRGLRLISGLLPSAWEPERRHLRGECLRGMGLFGAALREFDHVLRAGPRSDPALWTEAALAAVSCLRSVGRTRHAWRVLRRVREVLRRYAGAGPAEDVDLEEVLLLRTEGRWEPAISGLMRLRSGASGPRKAYLDWALGGAYRFQGRLAQAARSYGAARAGFLKARDRIGVGYAECGMAGVRRVQGRIADSIRHYGGALKLFEKTEDQFGLAYANCGLANGLRQDGRWKDAERYYRAAERLYRGLEDPADLGLVEWGLGEVFLRTGRLQQGLVVFRRAMKRFMATGEVRGRVLAMLSMAAAEHALGRTQRAEPLFDQAVRLARAAGMHTYLEIFT